MSENLQTGRPESIDDAGGKRSLRPDDGKIDGILARETEQALHVRILDGDTGRLKGDARIAGSTKDSAHLRAAAERIDDRMLAASGTDDQYLFHIQCLK